MALIAFFSQIDFTVSKPPCRILQTPFGKPISFNKRATNKGHPGSFSLGFNIIVLPVVIAKGIIHKGIMQGKLKGVTPAVTPKGTL
jgi:hypothetical protein